MTRTLVVTNDFPPRRGGIETLVRQLCFDLDPREVVVHTSSSPGDRGFDATMLFPVVRDPAVTLLPTPAVQRRVVATMRAWHCDRVVFGASAPLALMAPALRRAGAEHISALTHGHEVWWAALPVTRQAMRRIGDSVDALSYVSDYCRRRIEPALSTAARERLSRYPVRVDHERFHADCGGDEVRRRLGIGEDVLVVVCVGRLIRRKGQDTLIGIWPDVLRKFPDAVLLLVGDGPAANRLRRMAARRQLDDNVVFAGSVEWESVPAHMDAGDVFSMPCRSRLGGLEVEALGLVYAEAAACGLRVVPGRSGGSPEALDRQCR